MPPEQASGRTGLIGPRSDLYSLGCVVFEMACGRTPYGGYTSFDLIRQHVEGEVPDPGLFRRDLPPRLRAWVRTLMAKDPEDRFPTAEAALQALDETRSALSSRGKGLLRGIGGFFRRLLGRAPVPEEPGQAPAAAKAPTPAPEGETSASPVTEPT